MQIQVIVLLDILYRGAQRKILRKVWNEGSGEEQAEADTYTY